MPWDLVGVTASPGHGPGRPGVPACAAMLPRPSWTPARKLTPGSAGVTIEAQRKDHTVTDIPFTQRMNVHATDPKAYAPMLALEKYIHAGSLGEALLALVKLRASQINGCAFCLDMHGREARAAGVPQRQLDVLAGWQEAPGLYSARERAAIALTEQVTLISQGGVSDAVWARVAAEFSPQETVELLMDICAINSWNRLAITTHQDLPPQQD